jgi:rhodanese-related sulfurtransferase
MKHFGAFLIASATAIIISGCNGTGNKTETAKTAVEETVKPVVGTETELLLQELVAGGDYVNSQQYPSLIKASLVKEALSKGALVIDIRNPDKFKAGHIKGAVSKQFTELPGWFETGIKPFEYEKIIIVCDDGQLSSYTASLLRLKGYGNVFAMRWGMSSWNKSYANSGWFAAISSQWESSLDTVTHPKPAPKAMPELNVGKTDGPSVADAMFRKVFSDGTSSILVSAADVFANPSAYYVINLERKDKYEDGHIPGSVRYKAEGTLGIVSEMSTIPLDKPVVLYCGTGHNSAFATAYLRLMGYDAHTLHYGNHSFMYDRMVKQKATLSWVPFSSSDVNDFETVK